MVSKKLTFCVLLLSVIGFFVYHNATPVISEYGSAEIGSDVNEQSSKYDQTPIDMSAIENVLRVNESRDLRANEIPIVPDLNHGGSTSSNTNHSVKQDNTARLNVIFIIVDDLRPQISPYYGADYAYPPHQRQMFTPNLERLAGESIVFQRNYVQISVCGPSRTSLLTSRRPDTTRVNSNLIYWRETGGNFTTLPQYFRDVGYVVVGAGKVFHGHKSAKKHDPLSWSEPFYAVSRSAGFHNESKAKTNYWMSARDEDRKQYSLSDDIALNITLERLQYYAEGARSGAQPLFLAFGIGKPHTPLICPEKYYDMYPLEEEEYFLGNETFIYASAGAALDELRHFRRAYFACISYVDELIGALLDEVDKLGLSENTIISFTSDHGFHLGENRIDGKYTLYELSTHVPMMIRIPGLTDGGIRTRVIVESVDLFPTIVDAARAGTIRPCPDGHSPTVLLCTEGVSLMPVVDKPDTEIKDGAISQLQRILRPSGDNYNVYSLRTDQYRYIAGAKITHVRQNNTLFTVTLDWNATAIVPELYDHALDPGENVNVIDKSEYSVVIYVLHTQLRERVHTMYDVPYDNSWT